MISKKRNVIAVIGIETIRDANGNVKRFSDTFLDNMETYRSDHPDDNVLLFDSRKYVKDGTDSPIDSLLNHAARSFKDGVDEIIYAGHSDSEILYVFSRTRTDCEDEGRFIMKETDWSRFKFNPGARIRLTGCQAGGQEGKKWDECIAQWIADNSGVTVLAFVSKSSQRKIGNKYYQKPDIGGFVKFKSRNLGANDDGDIGVQEEDGDGDHIS